MTRIYTIGYGGRTGSEFIGLLKTHGIRTVADVRLRPDRASMGIFTKSKDPTKGIQGLLARASIQYVSLVELGNIFLDFEDWPERYRQLLEKAGDLLTERLLKIPSPFCLLCAEKNPEQCHRKVIAEYLCQKDYSMEHIQ